MAEHLMEELHSNVNGQSISISTEEESSSFVLQPNLNNNQEHEKVSYQLKIPLCVSQIYQEEFFDHFHLNYYGETEREGLFLASIRSIPIKINEIDNKSSHFISKTNNNEDKQLVRAIIRTTNNNYDVSEIINIDNEKNILQILFGKAQLSAIHDYEIIHHIKANEKIAEFDKYIDDQHTNKIALILQRLNQSNENEILGNNEMSTEMKNFLNLISERIELKDFNKFRGDLDIKTNGHGIYSYFTTYENHQIMFNIAPIIPSDKTDQQFILRKSLIANALLSIVFQEEGSSFQPNFILGKVTQVYITVQPIHLHSQLYYKIEIWRRDDIEPILDPSGGTFKHDQSFRTYFLTLILNTMNIILKKESFHIRIVQQRERLKTEYLQKLSQIFNSYLRDHLSISYNIENIDKRRPSSHRSHHLGVIPKIIETFTNYRSKPNSSDNQTTSTTNKQNLVMSQNELMKRSSIPNTNILISPPKVEVKLSSSLPSSMFHSPDGFERATETITSLIRSVGTMVGLNNETSSSATTTTTANNNTINQSEHEKNHTNLPLVDNSHETINNNQNIEIKQNN